MKQIFKDAYKGSYYTVIGCGGDINDWKNGYADLLKKEQIMNLDTSTITTVTGEDMNESFQLTGTNRYPDDLVIMMFPLTNVTNMGKLAMFKVRMEDHWFDDVVDNNLRREGLTYDEIAA